MPMPLNTLLDFEGNSYEIVVAVLRRAQQLTDIRVAYNPTTLEEQNTIPVVPEHLELPPEEKAVSVAFQEILDSSVTYKIKPE